MQHAIESPSARADSASTTPRAALDRAVSAVAEQRTAFARMPPREKAALLREVLPLLARVGRGWVEAGCKAKRIDPNVPLAGEEWYAGPVVTTRNTRLLVASLEQIAANGRPSLGRSTKRRVDGRIEVEVFPAGGFDPVLYRGFSCV